MAPLNPEAYRRDVNLHVQRAGQAHDRLLAMERRSAERLVEVRAIAGTAG